MSNDSIQGYLDDLNLNQASSIKLIEHTPDIFFGVVHYTSLNGKVSEQRLFFVKATDGMFVSAVHLLVGDLHWYTTETYRGKGILVAALREYIIPYLFRSTNCLWITINTSMTEGELNSAKGIATRVGFSYDGVLGPNKKWQYKLDIADWKKSSN